MAYNSEMQTFSGTDARLAFKDQPVRDRLADMAAAQSAIVSVSEGAEIIPYPYGLALESRARGGAKKRLFDVSCTLAIIALAAPLLVTMVIAARAATRGPLFYGHKRVGFRGEKFSCLKFRTMVVDADKVLAEFLATNPEAAEEWARDRKLRHDPRITAFGALLRKTSLDELPQLINVLRGEMSLVGPRPVTEEELYRYGDRRPAYLAARPGLTGLWQVSGRNSTTYERRTELDAHYVANWSLIKDIAIMLKTIPAMLGSSKGC